MVVCRAQKWVVDTVAHMGNDTPANLKELGR